jgi:hypothetical protein
MDFTATEGSMPERPSCPRSTLNFGLQRGSAPAWLAGILALLDRRTAEHIRLPAIWRSALRSHRPRNVGPTRAEFRSANSLKSK